MWIGELVTTVGVSTKTLRFDAADGLLLEPDCARAGDCNDTAVARQSG